MLLLATLGFAPGCYYAHLATSQTRLLMSRRPVGDVLADPTTRSDVAERLRLVGDTLAFAADFGLDVDAQYTSYVDWPGDRVLTTVVATRPGEIEARGFWFPIVGTMPYKGFFAVDRAEREAKGLRGDGLDVCLVPVLAYSTLGWFDDPLTAPMLRLEPERLVETILHELVHATVFVAGEPEFNEGVATFIGQEAAIRFAESRDPGGEGPRRARLRVGEDRTVAASLEAFRDAVAALYANEPTGAMRDAARAELEQGTRAELAALPLETRDAQRLAERVQLNDACQALTGTYQSDLGAYAARLEALSDDLTAFLERTLHAAEEDDPRAALLGGEAARP